MTRPVSFCALMATLSFVLPAHGQAADLQSPSATLSKQVDFRVVSSDPPTSIEFGSIVPEMIVPSAEDDSFTTPASGAQPRGGPETGACCFGEPICAIIDQAACDNEGLNWLGPDTTCDLCPQMPSCSGDSLFSQSPGNPFVFEGAGTSEFGPGLQRYEKFSDLVGPISAVTFYGFDLALTPGGSFIECVEADNTFQISFHPDVGNRPGEAVCTYTLPATRTPTGVYYIQGFELNEYEMTLPSSCVITRGWISIVGHGDPNCYFVWSSPPGSVGDDYSLCSGCVELEQGLDLAVCIRGTFGGIFGACCDASDGTCTDNVEIFQCIGPTETFTPDTTCALLTPACGVTTGACCGDGMTRGIAPCIDGVLEADCQLPGQRYEPNSVCQFLSPACGEETGPCCVGSMSCVVTTEAVCNSEGWTWIGPELMCGDCPTQTPCPANTLFGQPPLDIASEPSLYTSEDSRGATVYDDFSGVGGTITDIQFYGVDLQPVGPTSFIECEEFMPDFEVKFYEDQGNAPGPVVASEIATATRTPTGIIYLGAEYNLYQLELATPVAMTRGWVSIVGLGSPTCYFLWAPSTAIANGSVRELIDVGKPFRHNTSFAFCLMGTAGGVTGACCDQATGACVNGVSIENCVGPNDRFAADGTCAISLGDCGVPKGACCLGALACEFITSQDCASLGGEFLGVNSACLECPCKVFCSPQAIPEGEAVCSDTFVDTTNYGCDGPSPIFTTVVDREERICGSTGVYFSGETVGFDTDWYEIILTEPGELAYRFESESPATIRFLDGTSGCPGVLLDGISADPCSPLEFGFFLIPGTYWIQIEPEGPSDASVCGAKYQLTPLNVPCDADFDFDRDVDMLDFSFFQPQFGMAGPGFFGDLNGDDVIDINDVYLFEAELGTACP